MTKNCAPLLHIMPHIQRYGIRVKPINAIITYIGYNSVTIRLQCSWECSGWDAFDGCDAA